MSARLAAHWAAVTLLATAAHVAAQLPFTGLYATAAGIVAATGVGMAGLASAPHEGRR